MTRTVECLIMFFTIGCFCNYFLSQSIVNTEKLFQEKKHGLALSIKASGNIISGNADISLFKFASGISICEKY